MDNGNSYITIGRNWYITVGRNWDGVHEKPCLNQWYPCKHKDDWYKIIKQERVENRTLYKIVSYRDGKDMFYGLTLAQARSVIQIDTYKFRI